MIPGHRGRGVIVKRNGRRITVRFNNIAGDAGYDGGWEKEVDQNEATKI